MMVHKRIAEITEKIRERSSQSRQEYLKQLEFNFKNSKGRKGLSCGNLVHGFAGCSSDE